MYSFVFSPVSVQYCDTRYGDSKDLSVYRQYISDTEGKTVTSEELFGI